ncbi:bacteriophage abortive infection AbiH family protein [Psychroflexus sp. CAK57W]|uniref:AbiH family protein n=1 Tax=Psychroflexus curvus TaxID=2873595 RepID=UPI001CC9CEB6|nr:AbiH family protein [Psychroflexus curvus]MBZ9788210.1 bacteriophage abortive infection AbiH family protein [Psychroflexus curvus]
MNRIVLIGNGFDLAHGMKTSYKNFINDFWKRKCEEIKNPQIEIFEDDFIKFNHSSGFRNFNDFNSLDTYSKDDGSRYISFGEDDGRYISFKNSFLYELSKKDLESWVDIENEYYTELKRISKSKDKSSLGKLNKEFYQIKNALSQYLRREEEDFNKSYNSDPNTISRIKRSIDKKISSKFKFRDLSHNTLKKISNQLYKDIKADVDGLNNNVVTEYELTELSREMRRHINVKNFSNSDIFRVISTMDNTYDLTGASNLYPKDILLLNFNYTDTHLMYESISKDSLRGFQKIQNIKIHGCIYEPDRNPMIFGFGDELDKEYQDLEDLDDNEFLENIKSIKYLESENYRKLLEFAESDEFQIFIFGHSCGNSDRTLLNTLFEHDNCISIKPFYHIRKDGTDNYSNITQNISRNFPDKAKMRARVVNKNYTTTLTD